MKEKTNIDQLANAKGNYPESRTYLYVLYSSAVININDN